MAIKQIRSIEETRKIMADDLPVFYSEDGEYKQVVMKAVYKNGVNADIMFVKEFNRLLNHNREITVEIGDERLVYED